MNCSVGMIFDALSKELYSLKQGLSENVAKFRVCLLQQVQILQSEYPGRIQPKHLEEMKCAHFYEGLDPEYRECWLIKQMVSIQQATTTCY